MTMNRGNSGPASGADDSTATDSNHCVDHSASLDIEAGSLQAELHELNESPLSDAQMTDVIAGLRFLQSLSPDAGVGESHDAVDQVPLQSDGERMADDCTSDQTDSLAFLDRFEILRTLGSGGFGTVLLANDRQLGRQVAVKVYAPQIATSARLQRRFLTEAQALAELKHPQIIPLHDVGTEGALWYLVMGYCPGPTLADWIQSQLPREVSAELAAAIVAELAGIVHYAHSRGRLHRDIKPSNVMLDPSDVSISAAFPFTLLLTDFGLTRRIDAERESESSAGAAGTAWYMAPEQAHGGSAEISVQSDVYGLGAVLYELLVGQPPFAELGAAEWWRRIGDEPPSAVRSRRERLSVDLAAICHKCLEVRPSSRYVSALALQADLARFLRQEAVDARPVSRWGHFVRWCRRKPLVAGLAGALFLTSVAAACGMSWLWLREREQRVRADRRAAVVRQAIETYTEVVNEIEAGAKGDVLRVQLLSQTADFYLALADEEAADPDRQYELNVVLHQAANVQSALGKGAEAAATRRRCIAVLDQLLTREPNNTKYRFAHFQNLMILGTELSSLGDANWGMLTNLAFQEISSLRQEDPQNLTYLDAYCAAAYAAAEVAREHGDVPRCEAVLKEALAIATKLAQDLPQDFSSRRHRAQLLDRLGAVSALSGRSNESLAYRAQAVAQMRQVVDVVGSPAVHREFLVLMLLSQANALQLKRELAAAEEAATEALARMEPLIAAQPDRQYLRETRMDLEFCLAGVLEATGRTEQAEQHARSALQAAEELSTAAPENLVLRKKFASFLEFCPVATLRDPTRAEQIRNRR